MFFKHKLSFVVCWSSQHKPMIWRKYSAVIFQSNIVTFCNLNCNYYMAKSFLSILCTKKSAKLERAGHAWLYLDTMIWSVFISLFSFSVCLSLDCYCSVNLQTNRKKKPAYSFPDLSLKNRVKQQSVSCSCVIYSMWNFGCDQSNVTTGSSKA